MNSQFMTQSNFEYKDKSEFPKLNQTGVGVGAGHNFNFERTQYSKGGFYTPNSLDNRFGFTSSGFRSQSSNRKDDFYIFNKLNKKELNGYDNEKLRETILHLKKDINNKTKEINSLKVEVNLLNIEEKKKIKVIENILSSSGKSLEEIINIIDENKHVEKIDLSANSVIKLREIYVINFLKTQVGQLKSIIKEKDNEIRLLKDNSKVMKMNNLESEIQSLIAENTQLKNSMEKLQNTSENVRQNYVSIKEEHEALYKKYLKKTREYEKISSNIIKLEEENKILIKEKKKSDENSNKHKLSMINMKADLKYKTDFCNMAKESEEKIERLEKDKENMIKKIDNLNKEKVKLNFQNK